MDVGLALATDHSKINQVTEGKNQKKKFDVIIAGGGLAGLTAAILLSRKKKVLLIEKKSYPFHKVCGEYVSNEVLSFLRSLGFDPSEYGASCITKLRISTPYGKNIYCELDTGGFGLSRFVMDHAIFGLAVANGVEVLQGTKVTNISFFQNQFEVKTNSEQYFTSPLLIGSYGKRDALDKKFNRDFIQSRTGYMAVKYHIKTDYPVDEIGLDNFRNGYCGIVKIEDNKYNLCYLYKRQKQYNFSTVRELEETILFKNPVIRNIFSNSEFISDEPEVINEISFASKKPVEDHVFMCGDSAGLITPLCGNGMSMAIHSAKLLCDLILKASSSKQVFTDSQRNILEEDYEKIWNANFSKRLFLGRTLQKLFGSPAITGLAIRSLHAIPKAERWLIANTHGKPISDAANE